ncbi:helix-turn-helix domain-containing protein [Roseomonas genomospecies 6]|uniref:Cyclic nucleotide-binding protein n=1 Tax=Roseomonas genomospecies 6 TaxID=214106 RepID=A0A9W7NJR1_9PROT|nr:helix-turn-helix domain-containing protein [Roseomonas genomospecies 6]KAA0680700.1 cyclic nucleotide-binding protein [Roseomonas genomospecies 6]
MRQGALTLMRGLPLFEGVGDETLEALTYGALHQWFPRETRLFAEGEIPDFLHVLVEGTAMLAGCDEAGQETVIDIVRPGDCFVPAAVLADRPYLMSGRTLESSRILMLAAPVLRAQVARDHALALRMMSTLVGQCRGLVREVKNLKLRSTTQRLAAFILSQVDSSMDDAEDGVTVELPVSKRVLASRLGMTPEQLSRTFTKLSPDQLHVTGNTVRVRSVERLRRHCNVGHPDGNSL